MAASDAGRGASPPSGAVPPALEVIGVEKWFGSVHANSNINIRVAAGTIHGIIGENGAGKSTLMSVVYGYYQADSGEIRVNGKTLQIKGPEHAIANSKPKLSTERPPEPGTDGELPARTIFR